MTPAASPESRIEPLQNMRMAAIDDTAGQTPMAGMQDD